MGGGLRCGDGGVFSFDDLTGGALGGDPVHRKELLSDRTEISFEAIMVSYANLNVVIFSKPRPRINLTSFMKQAPH